LSEPMTRRGVLMKCTLTAIIGVVALPPMNEVQAAEKICADLKSMDPGARSIRESLKYTEVFPDAALRCGACAFFQTSALECGMCQIFDGLVNVSAHCDSWSPKN